VSTLAVALPGLAWACTSEPEAAGPPMTCTHWGTDEQLTQRPSGFDSAMVSSDAGDAKVCYSRPTARGRVVFGALVPWDTLWRTGANEATALHLSAASEIAGIPVDSGAYTLYTVPSEAGFTVVINASTGQWGLTMDAVGANGREFENAYTPEVRRREVGRAPIATEAIEPVDTLTAHFEGITGDQVRLLFDWETTRIVIPIRFGGS